MWAVQCPKYLQQGPQGVEHQAGRLEGVHDPHRPGCGGDLGVLRALGRCHGILTRLRQPAQRLHAAHPVDHQREGQVQPDEPCQPCTACVTN